MKKIALINLYSGINNRGAESFIHEFSSRLSNKYNVTLYSGAAVEISKVKVVYKKSAQFQPQHTLPNNFAAKIIKYLFLDKANLSVLIFSLKVLGDLLKEKPDFIIPSNGFWQLILCKLVSISTGSKIIVVGHSGPGWDEKFNLWLKPDWFVATTGPTGQWAKKVSPWTKIEVIPYGIDLEKFRNVKSANLNLNHPIILCNAAAVSYKRIDLTIKAVHDLKDVSLLHLGTGPEISSISEMGSQLLGSKFETRFVDHDLIASYYAACDLVTLASMPQENSPMVFLEAMAAGKGVVCTDTLRNRWILGECGVYVDPTNTDQYAKSIEIGLKNIDRNKIYERAVLYSWPTILKQYERLFEAI